MARNDVVQNMVGQQTSFCAGRLRDYLAQWKGLTSDPIILQYVAGVKWKLKVTFCLNRALIDLAYLMPKSELLFTLKLLSLTRKAS